MQLKFDEPLADDFGLFDSGVDNPYVGRYTHYVMLGTDCNAAVPFFGT